MIFLTSGVPKTGKLVGKDQHNNEYYQNLNDISGIYQLTKAVKDG
jgi:hypothetical protein